jgi:hypothetical protein
MGEPIIRCRTILLFYTKDNEDENLNPQHIENRVHSLDGQCYISVRSSRNTNCTIYLCWATFDDPLSIPNFNKTHIFDIEPHYHPHIIDGTEHPYETEVIGLTLGSAIVINNQSSSSSSTEDSEDNQHHPPAVPTNQAGTNSIPSSKR